MPSRGTTFDEQIQRVDGQLTAVAKALGEARAHNELVSVAELEVTLDHLLAARLRLAVMREAAE